MDRQDFINLHREAREARQQFERFEDIVLATQRYGTDVSSNPAFDEDHQELLNQIETVYLLCEDILGTADVLEQPGTADDPATDDDESTTGEITLPNGPPQYVDDRRRERANQNNQPSG